jgi:membrane protease YdiL (CAAX protease family)
MYASFAAVTLLVLALLVVLARASAVMFDDPAEGDDGGQRQREGATSEVPATGAARIERHPDTGQSRAERRERENLARDDGDGEDGGTDPDDDAPGTPWDDSEDAETSWGENRAEEDARRAPERSDAGRAGKRSDARRTPDDEEIEFTTGALLANVALSQGLFGVALVGAAWLAEIPPVELGVTLGDPWNAGLPAVGMGVALGVALYVGNELSAVVVDAAGVDYSEGLRETLAPDDLRGWLVLLGVVLPVIAGFEELLFRAALIGAFAAGFGLSPWLLAILSTVAFAIGHGAQGPGGIAVTGLLGFALGAAFVLTESLLVVVVAHYLVNALEFVVHEGFGVEWT